MLDSYDDDGFYIENCIEIKVGETYEVGNENFIGEDIRLNGINTNKWIEISQEMLDEYFTEVVV
jgi:hypothetical protein